MPFPMRISNDLMMLTLYSPGASAETGTRMRGGQGESEGVQGLKALGVRDLNYRLAFLACTVTACNRKVWLLFILSNVTASNQFVRAKLFCTF
jgi:hypothetical protein